MPKAKSITAKMILGLVEQQGYRCAISGRKLTPETASVDHIQPVSRGGSHELENLWIVDHQINLAKGSLSLEEFLAVCRDVHLHQQHMP